MLVKTFTETVWYVLRGDVWETRPADQCIDAQVRRWVDETSNVIRHPGQLSLHTTWYGDGRDKPTMRCVTAALVVMYEEAASDAGTTNRIAESVARYATDAGPADAD